jgi:hypothetical protein
VYVVRKKWAYEELGISVLEVIEIVVLVPEKNAMSE